MRLFEKREKGIELATCSFGKWEAIDTQGLMRHVLRLSIAKGLKIEYLLPRTRSRQNRDFDSWDWDGTFNLNCPFDSRTWNGNLHIEIRVYQLRLR